MRGNGFVVAMMLLALCFSTFSVFAGDDEIWWMAAVSEADRDGYRLLDGKGLERLLGSGDGPLLIDARADYEFEAGHIPGAVNLEFDLGDRMGLSDAKRSALAELVGPDKQRLMVVYCRSFR
ncbi:MAG: rhodanese-like domain-containing protein [Pseudodesulfovibrio sp.]|nr:rhodanese-like domain-containing protein [Pseudodesulfovibrio sp.]